MNVEFKWEQEPNIEQKKSIESKIYDLIENDIEACHKGILKVHLNINGPLEEYLQGVIQCHCGKELLSFKGDEFGNKLIF